jgi:tRNA-specific 2-thiouridylase
MTIHSQSHVTHTAAELGRLPLGAATPVGDDAQAFRHLLADIDIGPLDGEGRLAVAAMSGGVDSAVTAALLLARGYRVVGMNMRVYTPPAGEPYPNPCCAPESLDDARGAAQRLGVPFYPVNVEREFESVVINYFVDEYARGRTPNPCLECNRHVKFEHLLTKARRIGADFIATGHYARVERGQAGRFRLLEAVDTAKDQSYVLHTLSQEQLRHVLFPLGHLTKQVVRTIAERLGLDVAGKPESQDTCFVGKGAYADFVLRRRPDLDRPGEIVATDGRVLGEHQGLIHYTVGQRRGIGVAGPEPLYVLHLDTATNRLVVGVRDELDFAALDADAISMVDGGWPDQPFECDVRLRYRGARLPARVTPGVAGMARVAFAQTPGAVAPGQAVVFYDGDEVLGGGTIRSAALRAGVR